MSESTFSDLADLTTLSEPIDFQTVLIELRMKHMENEEYRKHDACGGCLRSTAGSCVPRGERAWPTGASVGQPIEKSRGVKHTARRET